MIKESNQHNLQTRKKHLKNDQELKFIFQNMPSQKTSNINTAQKSKMVRIEMYNLQTKLVQFKDQKKAQNKLDC